MVGVISVFTGVLWTFTVGGGLGVVVIGLKVFPILVVGGLDSVAGIMVGAVVIGVLESLSAGYLDPVLGAGFSSIAPYVLLLAVLFVRPYGMFGRPRIERV
jgi:branched-chain amino acid transport system permease protein